MVSLYTPGTPLTTFTSLSGPTRAQYRELAAARHGSFYYPARLETCLHCDIHTLSLDHHHHFTLTAYTITILSLFITSPSSTYFHQPGHSRLYDNDPVEHSHCPSDKVIIRSPQSHILHPVSVVRSQKHQLRTYPGQALVLSSDLWVSEWFSRQHCFVNLLKNLRINCNFK